MARARRERIFIVPRWAGLAFSVVLLMIFGLGFGYQSVSELTRTLGIALVVAGLVSLIQSNENLRGVAITGCRSTPVAAGEKPVLELTLQNSAKRERIGLLVRKGSRWTQAWRVRPATSAWVSVIQPGETTTVEMPLPVAKRGRYPVPELWVSSIMPVGLCFAWKVFPGSGDYYVYPAPRGFPLDGDGRKGQGTSQGPDGGSEDVSGHRPYEAGDPLTRVDWRVFARTGKVVVRTLEEGSGGEVALRWEDTRFLQDDEARLEQLSFWVTQCVRENRVFRLELGTRSDLSSRNIVACYEALATFRGGNS